jgi:CheY-like chemotaxis protein
MTITPIRKDVAADNTMDPLRQKLAAVIAEARKAEAVVVSYRAARERAENLVTAAATKCEEAGAAIDAARQQHAQEVADALRSATEVRASAPLKAAKLAEGDAQEALAAGNAALQRLTADLAAAEEASRWAANAVQAAVNSVAAQALQLLLADAMAAKIRFTVSMAIVGQVLSTDAAPSGFDGADAVRAQNQRNAPLAGLREQLEKLGASVTEAAGGRIASSLAAWASARSALTTDATAPLPLLPP